MQSKILRTILNSLILVLFLNITHEAKSITSEVSPFYEKFIRISKECGISVNDATLRIEMKKKLGKRIVAVCNYATNTIEISSPVWKRLTESEKEQTILHELSHCLLNQRHDDKDLNLMNSLGFIRENLYTENYDYFMRRLFKNCKKPLVEKIQ